MAVMTGIRLTERQLLEAAGEPSFGRGEDYVRYVRGARVDGTRATGSIQARNVYTVSLGPVDGIVHLPPPCQWRLLQAPGRLGIGGHR